jgi:hypothetical protein
MDEKIRCTSIRSALSRRRKNQVEKLRTCGICNDTHLNTESLILRQSNVYGPLLVDVTARRQDTPVNSLPEH